jgi:hypothetical protein
MDINDKVIGLMELFMIKHGTLPYNASLKGRVVECYKRNFIKTNYTYSSFNMGFKGPKNKGCYFPKHEKHSNGAC